MVILPVLDLMNGKIVRGIAGRREEYRPIISQLVDSAEPVAVARALADQFKADDFYLADLDAIQHGRLSLEVYHRLLELGVRLWIDCGLRSADDPAIDALKQFDAANIVLGLESLHWPFDFNVLISRIGVTRTVFSLDLKKGEPLGLLSAEWNHEPELIAEHVIGAGVRRMIVLDLAGVGVGAGVPTEKLCARLKQKYPQVEITTGGGVRNIDDVARLTKAGVDRVLVASALHDGRITAADIKRL